MYRLFSPMHHAQFTFPVVWHGAQLNYHVELVETDQAYVVGTSVFDVDMGQMAFMNARNNYAIRCEGLADDESQEEIPLNINLGVLASTGASPCLVFVATGLDIQGRIVIGVAHFYDGLYTDASDCIQDLLEHMTRQNVIATQIFLFGGQPYSQDFRQQITSQYPAIHDISRNCTDGDFTTNVYATVNRRSRTIRIVYSTNNHDLLEIPRVGIRIRS